ncbi:DUF2000 domain-containing protein [Priestia flexa]|uniref:DUF2000 domain-containing protein n=1 Tax=Priestia flexa TaxID=86664 RepID=UPI00289033E2|nr:DUF2000 domain-containing protein [Priestia flexa]MDT2044986.1 DUF2000 domain-containing protein [Priestia flexa]
MSHCEKKCVLVIDENLPLGLIANTAAILGVTLGAKVADMIGDNVVDGSGIEHLGIVKAPIPILKGTTELLSNLKDKTMTEPFLDLIVIDFSDAAQRCKTYEDYITKLQTMSKVDYRYFGLGIYGDKKKVNSLTGDIALLR